MPSKENICVHQDSKPEKLVPSSDVEELVAAIKHNLHLKSKPSQNVYSKHRRVSPYAAPVRSVCRNRANNSDNTGHSSPNCKYCLLRAKSSSKNSHENDDPYDLIKFLSQGILISEAVKRIQRLDTENMRPKKTNFYDSDEVESA